MGKRRPRGRQPLMWVASADLPRSAGNPFYERLNRVLDEAGFDIAQLDVRNRNIATRRLITAERLLP